MRRRRRVWRRRLIYAGALLFGLAAGADEALGAARRHPVDEELEALIDDGAFG